MSVAFAKVVLARGPLRRIRIRPNNPVVIAAIVRQPRIRPFPAVIILTRDVNSKWGFRKYWGKYNGFSSMSPNMHSVVRWNIEVSETSGVHSMPSPPPRCTWKFGRPGTERSSPSLMRTREPKNHDYQYPEKHDAVFSSTTYILLIIYI